jgi:calcineurin-like phosphoesterase family protein
MMLHGHLHSKPGKQFAKEGRKMDIGIDTREDFSPYNIEEVISLLKTRPISHCLSDDYHLTEGK